jgi:hypothetical protein
MDGRGLAARLVLARAAVERAREAIAIVDEGTDDLIRTIDPRELLELRLGELKRLEQMHADSHRGGSF